MLLVEYQTSCIATYRPASTTRKHKSRSSRLRRQMTKSAPPQRTSISALYQHTSGHVVSRPETRETRALTVKSLSDIHALSIEDIYQYAERERINYSTVSRRQNLMHAQSETQFFRHEQSSPISRPNTSASRRIYASRREPCTPVSARSEQCHMSRPNSIVPHPELRDLLEAEDTSDNEEFNMTSHTPLTVTVSPVSRDCCEIIGPQLCYECRKNRIRQVNRERSELYFPTMEPSEENLTTAAIVMKYLPGLSEQEVEDKLVRGEIARPSVRKKSQQPEFSDEEDSSNKPIQRKVKIMDPKKQKHENNITPKKTSELFFTNIRDLNYKIISGNASRELGFSNAVKKVMKQKDKHLSSKNYFPTFVSPRKVKMVRETNYKTYFEPPLIDKAKQDVEPAFFAGSDGKYTLPEKLPDELIFVDKSGNEVKASSSKGFTDKLSVSLEKSDSRKSDSVQKQTKLQSEKDIELEMLREDIELEMLREDEDENENEDPGEEHEHLSTGESERMKTPGKSTNT